MGFYRKASAVLGCLAALHLTSCVRQEPVVQTDLAVLGVSQATQNIEGGHTQVAKVTEGLLSITYYQSDRAIGQNIKARKGEVSRFTWDFSKNLTMGLGNNTSKDSIPISAELSGRLVPKRSGLYRFRLPQTNKIKISNRLIKNNEEVYLSAGSVYQLSARIDNLPRKSKEPLVLSWSLHHAPYKAISQEYFGELIDSYDMDLSIQDVDDGYQEIFRDGFDNGLSGWFMSNKDDNFYEIVKEGSNNVLQLVKALSDDSFLSPDLYFPIQENTIYGVRAKVRGEKGAICGLQSNGVNGHSKKALHFSPASVGEYVTLTVEQLYNKDLSRGSAHITLWNTGDGRCIYDDVVIYSKNSAKKPVSEKGIVEIFKSGFENGLDGLEVFGKEGDQFYEFTSPGYFSDTALKINKGIDPNSFLALPFDAKKGEIYGVKAKIKNLSNKKCIVYMNGVSGNNKHVTSGIKEEIWNEIQMEEKATRIKSPSISLVGQSCLFDDVLIYRRDNSVDTEPDTEPDDEYIPTVANIDTTVTPPAVFVGARVPFSAFGSRGAHLSYAWDFGDGKTQMGDAEISGDATHQYDEPGHYTVTLKVKNEVTGEEKQKVIQIAVMPDVHDMISNRALKMGDSAVLDIQYPIEGLRYEWKFADGSVLVGSKVEKKFITPGFKDIDLTIYDQRQGVNQEDEVLYELETRINSIVQAPIAGFSISGTSNRRKVHLDASKLSRHSGGDVKYTWDFGDGTRISDQGPVVSHEYTREGAYPITLVITDQYGRQDSFGKNINIATVQRGPDTLPFFRTRMQLDKAESESVSGGRDGFWKDRFQNTRFEDHQVSERATRNLEMQEETIFSYPYVIPKNIGVAQSVVNFEMYGPDVDPKTVESTINGKTVVSGIEHDGCTENSGVKRCTFVRFEDEFFQGNLRSGLNQHRVTFTGAGNKKYTFESQVQAFAGLRIPVTSINVIPDEHLESNETKHYWTENDGKKKLVSVYYIPQSKVQQHEGQDYVVIDVPIYAVDEAGETLDISGIFNAGYLNYPSYMMQEMIHGRAIIQVAIPLENKKLGEQKIDLTQIVMTAHSFTNDPDNCNLNNKFGAQGYEIANCKLITTTNELPKGLVESHNRSNIGMFHFANIVASPFGPAIPNGVYLNGKKISDKDISTMLNNYSGSTVSIVVGMVPFIGDGSTLIVNAYKAVKGEPVDHIEVVLASIGLTMDALSGGVADVTTPLKVIYSSSKGAKPYIKELVLSLKGKSISQASKILFNTAGFTKDLVVEYGKEAIKKKRIQISPKISQNIIETFKLAKESKGKAIDAFRLANKSYNNLKGLPYYKKQPLIYKIKIMKYGMFAPETAKVMAKCGYECLKIVGNIVNKLKKQNLSTINSIKIIEKFDKCQIGRAIIKTLARSARQCFSWINGVKTRGTSILGGRLANIAKDVRDDLVREFESLGDERFRRRVTVATTKLDDGTLVIALNASAFKGKVTKNGEDKPYSEIIEKFMRKLLGITTFDPKKENTGSFSGGGVIFYYDLDNPRLRSSHAERIVYDNFKDRLGKEPYSKEKKIKVSSIGISNTKGPCKSKKGRASKNNSYCYDYFKDIIEIAFSDRNRK